MDNIAIITLPVLGELLSKRFEMLGEVGVVLRCEKGAYEAVSDKIKGQPFCDLSDQLGYFGFELDIPILVKLAEGYGAVSKGRQSLALLKFLDQGGMANLKIGTGG